MGTKSIIALVAFYMVVVVSASSNSNTSFTFSAATTNFSSTDIICTGNASLVPPNSSVISMCLTPPSSSLSSIVTGRCMYNRAVQFSPAQSFSTAFSFNFLTSQQLNGEGFVFIIGTDATYVPTAAEGYGFMGWLNESTNGVKTGLNFGVEFDLKQEVNFDDPPRAHVGINLDSMTSLTTKVTPDIQTSDSTETTYAWVDYDRNTSEVQVRVSKDRRKPCQASLSQVVNLTVLLSQPRYVGFSASTGPANSSLSQPTIFDWAFDATGAPVDLWGAPSACGYVWSWYYSLAVGLASAVVVAVAVCAVWIFCRTRQRSTVQVQVDRGLPTYLSAVYLDHLCGPRAFSYADLVSATDGFKPDSIIGRGKFGIVFKGKLRKGDAKGSCEESLIAVKRMKTSNEIGRKEFESEVKAIGRLLHQNLVPLLGWCCDEGKFYIVYDYMPHGTLQELLFPAKGSNAEALCWERRKRMVSDVAAALAFLHEGVPGLTVMHRDVKSSNVLLDKEFNARLGDFGLARSYDKSDTHYSTNPAGTVGYMAPECTITGVATVKIDVYSFGALTLEVACGKKPADRELPGEQGLVYWVWSLHNEGDLLRAADPALQRAGGFDVEEMTTMLTLGLCCCHPDSSKRPTMRQVQGFLKGDIPISSLPPLPSSWWGYDIPRAPTDDHTSSQSEPPSRTSDSSNSSNSSNSNSLFCHWTASTSDLP
ncbi:hypothetical protein AXG93_93s1140 [Marchantia polymorpha subsp. ruderalis]|uniref:Protein kinase domain-containing protein n=1 Tax=Marchantia polymorpha subsp. ruderalis TaxID=1480154 RepID=A0A176WTY7_MARPO|nr:hypothetical protein AXG93_93s1140 [Marchantia polymorpha subsp. ruderalis]